jgi:hypothetical protein
MTGNTTIITYRLQALAESAREAFSADNLRRAEAAITGMRRILERHPEVTEHASWVATHRHLEDCLEASRGS